VNVNRSKLNINLNSIKFCLSVILTLFYSQANAALAGGESPVCAPADGLTLQVLGSGGPIADDGRASSGYLLWIDGKSRVLVDAGGGIFLRFGEAGADFGDLEHIAISHFHTDHSSDLSALLKSGYFSNRTRKLGISGPGPGGAYPGINAYLQRLLNPEHGAYAYLHGYLDGSAGLVKLEATEVDQAQTEKSSVYKNPEAGMEIFAIGVPHGPVPALAYRINIGQKSIVFAGDQNGNSKSFIDFARGVNLLVMHLPVPENIGDAGRNLHATPSVIGKIAAETGAVELVLSHFMARSLEDLEDNLNQIRSGFNGIVTITDDLDCIRF
jgi:ribonuclease BN (tRNA processing enzyme)